MKNTLQLSILGTILVGLSACAPQAREAQSVMTYHTPLTTATVRVGAETLQHELPATVRAAHRAVLAPKVMGVIVELDLELGQEVTRGQILVNIAAQEIAARVEQARIAERQAARDLERETKLLERNATTAETVRNLEDRVLMARAALLEAETTLAYTRITAPFDGVVARKLAEAGDLAVPGQPLLELERSGRLRLEADVPESLARGLTRGDTVVAVVDGKRTSVTLAEISASADLRTRTLEARFDLAEGVAARPGMFARLLLDAGTIQRIAVPAATITAHGQVERVFVVEDGVARLRVVRTGQRSADGWVTVHGGLAAGDRLIVNPPRDLVGGMRVEIR
jgi:membrane fusion protein, multidrug efflux system